MRKLVSESIGGGVINPNWGGFYGPAYTRLLAAHEGTCGWSEAWADAVQRHEENPIPEGHWEFLAIGYLHLEDRADALSQTAGERLRAIVPRFQSNPTTANWRLMALAVAARRSGRRLTFGDLLDAGIVPTDDGCLPDSPGEVSSQYHAYILLLILRFGDRSDLALRHIVVKAVTWMERVHAENGDPSPIGRGRFQLFGYAAMAAAAAQGEAWGIVPTPDWTSAVWRRCVPETPSGALSSHWSGPHREFLLYGYNTTDDYACFAKLWLSGIERMPILATPAIPSSGALWLHMLDHRGSCVLAGKDGPMAVLLCHSGDQTPGRKALIANFVRRVFSSKEPLPAPIKCAESGVLVHLEGFELVLEGCDLQWRISAKVLAERLALDGPVLWLPDDLKATVTQSGSVEIEDLRWSRKDARSWRGYFVRAVRQGALEIRWAI